MNQFLLGVFKRGLAYTAGETFADLKDLRDVPEKEGELSSEQKFVAGSLIGLKVADLYSKAGRYGFNYGNVLVRGGIYGLLRSYQEEKYDFSLNNASQAFISGGIADLTYGLASKAQTGLKDCTWRQIPLKSFKGGLGALGALTVVCAAQNFLPQKETP